MKSTIMKKTLLCLCAAAAGMLQLHAASPQKKIIIPDTMEYQTLVCDFHCHTVFSDAIVWPSARVLEAADEGLDCIAITDHIGPRKNPDFVKGDQNASYDLALSTAEAEDILLIRGGEITRGMPPGHWNAIFLQDVNPLYVNDPEKQLVEAQRQGGYTFWNHPGWSLQAPNETVWMPLHEEYYQKGYMMGIEIINGISEYYPEAFRWALEKNLTIFANTDCHQPMYRLFDYYNGGHRTVTLVFARERSLEGVREALDNHRTAAYFYDNFYGREDVLRQLFESCLTLDRVVRADDHVILYLKNNTSAPIKLRKAAGSENLSYTREFTIRPGETWDMWASSLNGKAGEEGFDVNFEVANFFITPEDNLKVTFHILSEDNYTVE